MPGLIQPPMWCPGIDLSKPDAQGLAGYWPFWEGDGDKAMDLAGNGNRGTLTNGPTWVGSRYGWVLDLVDSGGEYINCGDDLALFPRAAVTHSVLVRVNVTTDRNRLTSFGKTDSAVPYLNFGLRAQDTWSVGGSPNGVYKAYDTGVAVDSEWHYFTATYDSSIVRVYLDGVQIGSDNVNWTGALADASGWTRACNIGKESYFAFYTSATLASVSVYDRALTPSEIQRNYADPWHLSRWEPSIYPGVAAGPGVAELFAASQIQPVLHNPAPPVPVPY